MKSAVRIKARLLPNRRPVRRSGWVISTVAGYYCGIDSPRFASIKSDAKLYPTREAAMAVLPRIREQTGQVGWVVRRH